MYQELGRGDGIPEVYGYYKESDRHNCEHRHRCYLVMERLGPNLFQVMQRRRGRPRLMGNGLFFSAEEILTIGQQIVSALQTLHNRSFVHRDVHPGNIVYDRAQNRVLLIDYTAASRYCNPATRRHYVRRRCGAIGSCDFTSMNRHRGYALSRRDDLESLDYVLVYLFRGRLPWQYIWTATESDVAANKSSIAIEDLGGGVESLTEYFRLVRKLSFDETPDYDGLRGILRVSSEGALMT